LVALDVEDCGVRGRDLIVRLRRGKTDQEGEGREVVIPSGKASCPVHALREWLRKARIRTGPVFRRVSRDGLVSTVRLPAGAVAQVVKMAAQGLGLDPNLYAGHSLRAGYVTTAALSGVPLWQIKKQTGHSTETMVETYVRDGHVKTGPSFL
jgi:integrase